MENVQWEILALRNLQPGEDGMCSLPVEAVRAAADSMEALAKDNRQLQEAFDAMTRDILYMESRLRKEQAEKDKR